MLTERSSGIILHITSLPSRFGIGDLGPEAYHFANFLSHAGARYWQILPLNPVEGGSGYSPYSGLSAFAGNPMLISPELLQHEGYLQAEDLEISTARRTVPFAKKEVDFPAVVTHKKNLFRKAYEHFKQQGTEPQRHAFQHFCKEHIHWLNHFADYMAFKNHYEGKGWMQWPAAIRDRQPEATDHLRHALHDSIEYEKFLQFIFFHQWETLKRYCAERHVHFFGDIPFYVGQDSADVWAHSHLFKLKPDKQPEAVAGVPPDYFSQTGQLWGMPVFRWDVLRNENYAWWIDRITHNLQMFDVIRLDHFRAFSAYWEVPAEHTSAIHGQWIMGPGAEFFHELQKSHHHLPIIAEDLGEIDQPVYDLMDEFGFPGMKVLQFAFDDSMPRNPYIPHYHVPNSVVYTGTHDNNTARGWFENGSSVADHARVASYLNTKVHADTIAPLMVRLAMSSVSKLAIVPMQDVLGLGEEAIMNRPSVAHGNWKWRLLPGQATEETAEKFRELVKLYNR